MSSSRADSSIGDSSEMRTQSAPSKSSMLKTSVSTSGESSTTISTSVCGLKYVPGRMTMSSRSNCRGLAMAYLYQFSSRRRRSTSASTSSASQARPRAAAVARLDERAQLVAQLVVAGAAAVERGELRLDVQRRLAAPRAPGVARFEQLADLLVAVVRRRGRGGSGVPDRRLGASSPPLPISR